MPRASAGKGGQEGIRAGDRDTVTYEEEEGIV